MNKFLLSYAIFTMPTVVSYAQIKLNGSYIATKICYLNDEELPEDNALKYAYVKYTFSNSDQISWSGVYFDRGTPFPFVIDGKRLIVKSEAGYMINIMKIMESTAEKFVLVCSSENGSLEDPLAIKYTLYNEQFVQKTYRLAQMMSSVLKRRIPFINPDRKSMLNSMERLFDPTSMKSFLKETYMPKVSNCFLLLSLKQMAILIALKSFKESVLNLTLNISKLSILPSSSGNQLIITTMQSEYG